MNVTSGARADGPSLSRECSDLLVEFSTALHKHAIYPAGHPALASVASTVIERASRLFTERDQIAIGVARHQLIIEGVPTDPEHPVLARLADALHAHHLGAITLFKGLDATELGDALRALSVEPERHEPLGLRSASSMPTWRTVRLHPLTFDKLSLVESAGGAGAASEGPGHGSELWLGLAQAALAGQTARQDGPIETDPTVLARAIDAHEGAQAYDQLVVGYLLQIAQALRSSSAVDAEALRERTSGLIGALRPETLRRLVRASQSAGARGGFIRDAVQGWGVGAVLDVLKATADVTGETISDGLTRMLSKLAAQTASDVTSRRAVADEALRGQVTRLLADWRLEDPNPESYGHLLTELSGSSQRTDEATADARALDGDVRLVEMALEVGELGPLAAKAVDRVVGSGNLRALLGLLENPPADVGDAAAALRARLVAPDAVARLLATEPVDVEALDQLAPWMSASGYELLLDALIESSHRATRRRLIDRLASAPHDLSAAILARLDDDRWHVQRNMLHLLERRQPVPEGFSVVPWLSHEDWRVRHEAVRLALCVPGERDLAVQAALADDHPRVATLGLLALGDLCPPEVVGRVTAVAGSPTAPEAVRVLALRALGHANHASALATLIAVVDGGRTFFGRARLAAPDAACLAALRALAQGFGTAHEAKPFLDLARASRVEAVRAAVRDP